MWKIEAFSRQGLRCPEGLVVNSDGQTETDPDIILEKLLQGKCAFTPIGGLGEETGGYKGYGFTAVVEILSSALQQGAFLKRLNGRDEQGKPIPYALGHFFMAIDIECFTDPAAFKKTTGDILRALRASAKVSGQERIYTCGEKEYLAGQKYKDKGVPLDSVLQRQLREMRDELNLQYTFPFETA